MTDAADAVDGEREEFLDGQVAIEYEPIGGGKLNLTAYCGGEVIESSDHKLKIFGSTQLRNTFLNSVEESLEAREAVDAEAARREMKEWFAEMNQLDTGEEAERVRPAGVSRIIEGTHYPVEIHGGETTTWHVELSLNGRTDTLEFTAAEMTGGGPKVLEEKIANRFFELIKVSQEDWQAITRRWAEDTQVVSVVEETAEDTIADAVLRNMAGSVLPVESPEDMNDSAAAVYDPDQTAIDTTLTHASPDAPVLWVQDDFLRSQLEDAGKKLSYKSRLVQDLIKRGELFDGRKRPWWDTDSSDPRMKVYPFDPEALGVTPDDVSGGTTPNHSEVDA